MRPILFKWRRITVWSYPAMLYIGLLSGVVVGNMAAHAAGLDGLRVYIATMILIVPALAGARLLYVFAEWRLYRENLSSIWDRNVGGYIMYGGLPLALICSVPLLRVLHLGFAAFWDVAILTILVGMAFTRIGCLLNGCCGGRPSPSRFALYLPNRRGAWEKRIPTQLLESSSAIVLFLIALAVRRSTPFPGALFLLVSLGYALGRLLTECVRERPQKAGRFNVAHIISLTIVLLAVSTLTIYWHK
jgi:phosphatidylglycerol:prolipoprotein diacylglycerol transferase